MIGAKLFCKKIKDRIQKVSRVQVTLFGSLSLTGKGHLSDKAVIWGLNGLDLNKLDSNIQESIIRNAMKNKTIKLGNIKDICFIYDRDIIFNNSFLPLHQNAMNIKAFCNEKEILNETYYSIGGGFIKTEEEMLKGSYEEESDIKLKINSAKDIINIHNISKKNLAEISLEYELQFHTKEYIDKYCLEIWEAMQDSFIRGCNPKSLNLPGPLNLHRRAKGLYDRLSPSSDPFGIVDYISLYAIAIAEENASGGKVVTAPTNGACAVVPSVMLYLKNHTATFDDKAIIDFLLCAMLIGSLYKKNASISGAEAGCQAEIGSASSMAAAAITSVLGANIHQACSAAEIAMEHHLGLTCDPAFGLVQIPCIERNAFGAIKAISAARMAINRRSTPIVSLDKIIETMYQTGKDMDSKYKETALGGLAKTINMNVC